MIPLFSISTFAPAWPCQAEGVAAPHIVAAVGAGDEVELRRIDIPTTLIWGSHDRFVRLDHAERASRQLGWPLRVIDETGHVPHIERTGAFLNALPTDIRTTVVEEVTR